jgi:lipopolysaccharide/colanic/teichoic acid biosynthesis glycosyltransferase
MYTPATELLKNIFDRTFSLVALVILSPLLVLIAIAVRLDSKGPALFKQKRIGLCGKPFIIYKFRGMHVDARERFPQLYNYKYSEEEISRLYFHFPNDPRVTRIGRILRRTSLDELPNFLNVALGHMSLVGPRPEIPDLVIYYGEAKDIILSVKPGITSLAKLMGRDALDFRETLVLEAKYVRMRSPLIDLKILIGTAWQVITGRSIGY